MEGKGSSKLLLIFVLAVAGFFIFFNPLGDKKEGAAELQPGIVIQTPQANTEMPADRPAEELCKIKGEGYNATFSTHGASLKNFFLKGERFAEDSGHQLDLSTTGTGQAELRRQLRFDWRNNTATKNNTAWLVPYDSLAWTLSQPDDKTCIFTYADPGVVTIKKTVKAVAFSTLEATATITNTGGEVRRIALAIGTPDWRTNAEVETHFMRQPPEATTVQCATADGEVERLTYEDFTKKDFNDGEFFLHNDVDNGSWYEVPGKPIFAGVANYNFAHAIVPLEAPADPVCQMQIEYWDYPAPNEESSGAMYRARLAYPPVNMEPNESLTYGVGTFIGHKNRTALAEAFGGKYDLGELVDLGFFSFIATYMAMILAWIYGFVGNWGISIIVLTVFARVLLFPLSIPSVKNMVRMRELKPEVDKLNEKFKNDPQAKGVAQMELWRKHGVNPLKGCLPQLASMPIWFALYTTLQQAPELYNTPFLWLPDLSTPDPYYILPLIIGGTFFVQQKIMPMQGDPAQRKMMMYFMPGMFTVFMLFLPSGLGVYMFTNSLLAIGQQQLIEWHMRRNKPAPDPTLPPAAEEDETTEGAKKKKPRPKRRARRTRKVS